MPPKKLIKGDPRWKMLERTQSEEIRRLLEEIYVSESDEDYDTTEVVLKKCKERSPDGSEEEEDTDDYKLRIATSILALERQPLVTEVLPKPLHEIAPLNLSELYTSAPDENFNQRVQHPGQKQGESFQEVELPPPSQQEDSSQPSTSSGLPSTGPTHSHEYVGSYADISSSDGEEDDGPENPEVTLWRNRKSTREFPSEVAAEDSSFPGGMKLPPVNDRVSIPWQSSEDVTKSIEPLPFKPSAAGIQVEIPDEFDELDAFMLFMRNDIWDLIACETNRYYQRKIHVATTAEKRPSFIQKDVSAAEVRAYIGLLILLGIQPPNDLRTPWRKDSLFRNEDISNLMSYTRFTHMHNNFHLVDNQTLPDPTSIEYKTARISPILIPLQEKCRSVHKANSRNLSIDEGSMGWKGHSAMRQYNPSKPHKYHIKIYKLVESETAYLSEFIIHDTTRRSVDEVVLTLLGRSVYKKNEGYAIFTDRFYTSPDLFWHLRTNLGFDATGTVLQNRRQVPEQLKVRGKKPGKGTIASFTASKDNDHLVAMKWTDAKDVFMLSTESTAKLEECSSQKGRVVRQKPRMIALYNKFMGGVDVNDYLEARYSPCRSTKKLWRKMALYLISTAVTNAYIIHSMAKPGGPTVRESAHAKFREKLGTLMFTMNDNRPGSSSVAISTTVPVSVGHLAKFYPVSEISARKGSARRAQHRCQRKDCNLKSFTYCCECNKCLCINPDHNCFYEYHTDLARTLNSFQQEPVPVVGAVLQVTGSESSSLSADERDTVPPLRSLPLRKAAKRSRSSSLTPPSLMQETSEVLSHELRSATRADKARKIGELEGTSTVDLEEISEY